MVVERRRVCSALERFFVDDAIDFIGGDTGFDGCPCDVEYFACDSACCSHFENLFGSFHLDDPRKESPFCLGLCLGEKWWSR
jgi:hypothetical protein